MYKMQRADSHVFNILLHLNHFLKIFLIFTGHTLGIDISMLFLKNDAFIYKSQQEAKAFLHVQVPSSTLYKPNKKKSRNIWSTVRYFGEINIWISEVFQDPDFIGVNFRAFLQLIFGVFGKLSSLEMEKL